VLKFKDENTTRASCCPRLGILRPTADRSRCRLNVAVASSRSE
jgi:hypothetical protein